MTIEKWLSDLSYDGFTQTIWNNNGNVEDSQMICHIRGWGFLQYEFNTVDEACKFQDEVGEFIVQAIREKIEIVKQKQ